MLPYDRDARNPVRNADVLDEAIEINQLNSVITNYNSSASTTTGLGLDGLAKTYGLPAVDLASGRSTLDVNTLFGNVAGVISVGEGGILHRANAGQFLLPGLLLTHASRQRLASQYFHRGHQQGIPVQYPGHRRE
jgi:hypothetical protein